MNSIPKAKITRRKQDLDNAASKGRFVQYVLRKYNHAAGY